MNLTNLFSASTHVDSNATFSRLFLWGCTLFLCSFTPISLAAINAVSYDVSSYQRVDRTHFDYNVRILARNSGTAVTGVSARVVSYQATAQIIDSTVSFEDLPSNGERLSTDTFTVRIDRQHAFDPKALGVEFQYSDSNEATIDPEGYYTLKNLDANVLLTAMTSALTNSYPTVNNALANDPSQLWQFIPAGTQPDHYHIKSAHSGFYLRCYDPDPTKTSEGNGANVTLSREPRQNSAIWGMTYHTDESTPYWQITCSTGDRNLRGYDPYGSPKSGDGATVTTQATSSSETLKWQLESVSLPTDIQAITIVPGVGVYPLAEIEIEDSNQTIVNLGTPTVGINGGGVVLVPTSLNGPVTVTVKGNDAASYYDVRQGENAPFIASEQLSAIISDTTYQALGTDKRIGVTALTHLAAQILSRAGNITDTDIQTVNQTVLNHFTVGVTNLFTPPVPIKDSITVGELGNTQAGIYTAHLVALAESMPSQGSSQHFYAQLINDILDGTLNGALGTYSIPDLVYGPETFLDNYRTAVINALVSYAGADPEQYDADVIDASVASLSPLLSELDLTDIIESLQNQNPQSHREQLYAFWRFDDVHASSASALDHSGKGHHLSFSDWGGLEIDTVSSPVASEILDDPASPSDRHGARRGKSLKNTLLTSPFKAQHHFSNEVIASVNQLSVSMWVRPADNQKGYLWSLEDNEGRSIGLQMYNNTRLRFYSEAGVTRFPGFSTTSIEISPAFNAPIRNNDITQGWMQVTVVLVANQGATFYLDGEWVGEVNMPALTLTDIANMRVGQTFEVTPSRAFVGIIDNVRLYTKSLTQAELLSDYIEDATHGPWAFEVAQPKDSNGREEADEGALIQTIHVDGLYSATSFPFSLTDSDVINEARHNAGVLQNALDSAAGAGLAGSIVKVLLPPNDIFYVGDIYKYSGTTFTIQGLQDVIVDGNGSRLIHTARRGMFDIDWNADEQINQRLLIRNLTLDYFNEAFPFQTHVKAYPLENNKVRLTLLTSGAVDYIDYFNSIATLEDEPGSEYPIGNTVSSLSAEGDELRLPFTTLYSLVGNDTDGYSIVGEHDEANVSNYDVEILDSGDFAGSAVVDLSSNPAFYNALTAGDHLLVVHYGGKRAFSLQHSENVSFENIQIVSSPGNGLAAYGGVRYLKLKDVSIARDPQEDDVNAVVATKADGVFLFHNRGNYLLKRVKITDGTEDRLVIRELMGFNPQYVGTHQMVVCYASNARPVDLARVGDTYQLRDRDMEYIWHGTLTEFQPLYKNQEDPDWLAYGNAIYPNGSKYAKACNRLTFDAPIPAQDSSVYRTDTMVLHFNPDGSAFSSNYILIGSTLGNNRGNGAKFSSPHGLISHNVFASTTHQGVKFPLMIDMLGCSVSWGNNGSGPRNIVFSHNQIKDVANWSGENINTLPPAALSIFTNRYTPQTVQSPSCSRVQLSAGDNPLDTQWTGYFNIHDNLIENTQRSGISVQSAGNVLLSQNRFEQTNTAVPDDINIYTGIAALQITDSRQTVAWDNHFNNTGAVSEYYADPDEPSLFDLNARAYSPAATFLMNGNFELNTTLSDTIQTVPGWTEWNNSDASYVSTLLPAHSGNAILVHESTSGHYVSTKQLITDLPAGRYRVSGYSKRSEGLQLARIRVLDHGGSEVNIDLPVSDNWQQVAIQEVNVSSGQLQIVVTSKTNQGGQIQLDDLIVERID